jgi:hypothetical protein
MAYTIDCVSRVVQRGREGERKKEREWGKRTP